MSESFEDEDFGCVMPSNSSSNSINYNNYGSMTPPDMTFGSSQQTAEISSKHPKILLMGLRRSGKSSIQKVVFHKMSPNETLYLESTNKLVKNDISNSSFIKFQTWDFPGQLDIFDPTFDLDAIFGSCGALIFVIDAQDDYSQALQKLNQTVDKAYKVNPDIAFEVFIHKVDGLSDDHKIEVHSNIHKLAQDDLIESKLDRMIQLSFYLTSIYDHSIFEAFSKVIQKLIPQLPNLEQLLNNFVNMSKVESAFLIDVVSKIYIATDTLSSHVEHYELCSDMIDVVIDISCIYGTNDGESGMAYDSSSYSTISLSNNTVLYLRQINKYLALVAMIKDENFEKHGLIDYNFGCLKNAIREVFNKT